MRKIRIFLLFCLMFIFSTNLLANDWEFGSEGGHIVPMNVSNIAIKSEKLHFKLEKVKGEYGPVNEMLVTVRFVFDSPEAGEKYIGFITPEGGNEEWDEVNHFKNFNISSTVSCFSKILVCVVFSIVFKGEPSNLAVAKGTIPSSSPFIRIEYKKLLDLSPIRT